MKNFKLIAFALVAFVFAVSCVKDDVVNYGKGDRIVGFKNSQASYIYTDEDVDPVHISEPINLVGGSNGTVSDVDIVIPFTVDPSSTAEAGSHYTIDATASLTLTAGADFVQLPITVIPTNLPGNNPKTIVINLGEPTTPGVIVADNKKQITITIAKCASELEGTYSLEVTRVDNGVVYNFPNEQITELSLGVYETSTTGPYDDLVDDGAPRNGFIFKDVCQSIQVDEQNLGDYYSNLVEGDVDAGSVTLHPVTGEVVSITIKYSIRGFASGVARRYFVAVYTKL